jgi:hypothetical protein
MTGSESHISSGCDNLCHAALVYNKHQNGLGRFLLPLSWKHKKWGILKLFPCFYKTYIYTTVFMYTSL